MGEINSQQNMRMRTGALIMLLVLSTSCTRSQQAAQNASGKTTDVIRAAFCDMDKGDYESALRKIEPLSVANPKDLHVRELLLVIQGKMIKQDDKSPQNIALVRKTIDGYSELLKDFK